MKKLLEYVDEIYKGEDPEKITKTREVLENLFFTRMQKSFRRVKRSDECKFANDLMRVERLLKKHPPSLYKFRPKSKLFAEKSTEINTFLNQISLMDHEVIFITQDFLNPNDIYKKACFVASVFESDRRKERNQWIIRGIFGIISGILGFIGGFITRNFPELLALLDKVKSP